MWKSIGESELVKAAAQLVVLLSAWLWWKADAAPAAMRDLVYDMRNEGRNELDLQLLTRNYYEELIEVDRSRWAFNKHFGRMVLTLLGRDPKSQERMAENCVRITETIASRPAPEYLEYELVPNTDITWRGHPLHVNAFGMRDREYPQTPPPGALRIAIIEASNGMGMNVAIEDAFPDVLEVKLNELVPAGTERTFEVLNFSIAGYSLLDRLYVIDARMAAFEPDMIILVATQEDLRWAVNTDVAKRATDGLDLYFDFVIDNVSQANVKPNDSVIQARRRLNPVTSAIVSGVFERFGRICQRRQVTGAIMQLYLRTVGGDEKMQQQGELAEQFGLPVFHVDALVGEKPEEVYVHVSDLHPTPYGHRLIAELLLRQMLEDPTIGPMIQQHAGLD